MYHVLALQSARALNTSGSLSLSGLLTNTFSTTITALTLPTNLLYSVTDLESVTQTKSKTDVATKSIMHLCGNKWCMNSGHYFVGTKIFNDEQSFCHKGLHNAITLQEYLSIQLCYCKHTPKCWANPHAGEFDLTAGFCETGLPVVVVDEVE
jgi:hypothetical protein